MSIGALCLGLNCPFDFVRQKYAYEMTLARTVLNTQTPALVQRSDVFSDGRFCDSERLCQGKEREQSGRLSFSVRMAKKVVIQRALTDRHGFRPEEVIFALLDDGQNIHAASPGCNLT
jgi:hypothetical protein